LGLEVRRWSRMNRPTEAKKSDFKRGFIDNLLELSDSLRNKFP
jgi:hypothetical protein